jgi:hypothetical protein
VFNEALGDDKEDFEIALINPKVHYVHQHSIILNLSYSSWFAMNMIINTIYYIFKIVYASPHKTIDEESCLSFPGVLGNVERSTHIAVRYQDLEGRYQYAEFHGILARGIAHELDHLDKVLFIDRFVEEDLNKNAKRLQANIRQFGEGARP